MYTETIRVLMTREGADPEHEAMINVPATILKEPKAGELVEVYFDDGKWLRTTEVKRVEDHSGELTVSTKNSTYRIRRLATVFAAA